MRSHAVIRITLVVDEYICVVTQWRMRDYVAMTMAMATREVAIVHLRVVAPLATVGSKDRMSEDLTVYPRCLSVS